MLWVLFAAAALDLGAMIVLAGNADYFLDHLYSAYNFVTVLSTVLYYVIVVVYLVWIYRVHMDLRALFPGYPRSPGQSLACMMIPFYSFYGVPSTFHLIGRQFRAKSSALRKTGAWVGGLAAPLLIGLIASNILNRLLNSLDEPSVSLFVVSSVVTLLLYAIFLILCLAVSQGLKLAVARPDAPAPSVGEFTISLSKETPADASAERLS